MTFKSAEQFISTMKSDNDLRDAVTKAKCTEEFQQVIQSGGFDFNNHELAKAVVACMHATGKESHRYSNASSVSGNKCSNTPCGLDEHLKILISIGAAVAANCIPCVEHYFYLAETTKVDKEHINIAIEIAKKVKNGAAIAIHNAVNEMLEGNNEPKEAGCCKSAAACC